MKNMLKIPRLAMALLAPQNMDSGLEGKGLVEVQYPGNFAPAAFLLSQGIRVSLSRVVYEWLKEFEVRHSHHPLFGATNSKYSDLIKPLNDLQIEAELPGYQWDFVEGIFFFAFLVRNQLVGNRGPLLTDKGSANFIGIRRSWSEHGVLGVRWSDTRWNLAGWQFDKCNCRSTGYRVFSRIT